MFFQTIRASGIRFRRSLGHRLSLAALAAGLAWAGFGLIASQAADDPQQIARSGAVTQHDVLPILLRRCTVCHGHSRREGGLDLRTRASMLKGGKSGPAFVPGQPDESPILKKLRKGEMPPPDRLVEVSIKPIEATEIEVLTKWIARGAPEGVFGIESQRSDPLVKDSDRAYWAFRPPQAALPPSVQHPGRVRNPIDAFVLQKLEAIGLTLSTDADRATLLRRACLDLTGLPPEPAEILAFLNDPAPDAYEKLIDRLLASPRYGERWGRHWLDAAGYADSEGKREQDIYRPSAWRYRDYVIRSFNADKPYDRFLLEQLAGDELADYEHTAEITPAMADNLVATGFLRMAPDPTWANITNFVPDRLDVIDDELDVFCSTVLGLTLKCARCHDHKFDPLPQRDYYRMAAIFKGAYDENDWLRPGWVTGISSGVRADRELPFVSTVERRAWQEHNAAIRAQIDALGPELPPLGPAAPTPPPEAVIRRRDELKARLWPEPTIRALWDRGEPSPTYVLLRGDPLRPGSLVEPGAPAVLTDPRTPYTVAPPWPGARQTGRRLALARWVTQPSHPLAARVMVNRIWKHHFGRGLVATLGNFGAMGDPPTHPELLDWLACEFMRQDWSLKTLHRLMVTSATYRQSSSVAPIHLKLDRDNALLSRMPLMRMDAEVLYDSMLSVAGRLDEDRFGPPDPVQVRDDGLVTPKSTSRGFRRSVYVRQQRKLLPSLLENFDLPQMNPNCLDRRNANVATQALHLMNDGMVFELAEQFARRAAREVGDDPLRQIEWVYLAALGRPPSQEERNICLDTLGRVAGTPGGAKLDRDARALAVLCHTILNSAAYLYID